MQSHRISAISLLTLVILLVIWPAGSAVLQVLTGDEVRESLSNRTLELYLPTIIVQLLILGIAIGATKLERRKLDSLGYDKLGIDKVLLGTAFFFGSAGVLAFLTLGLDEFGIAHFEDPSHLLPVTLLDKIVWVILALVVAVAEETAFRGYALTRLVEFTGSRVIATLIVSTTFALGHVYQGSGGVIVIFVYALMFAILFFASKSIWPCIIAHFLQDIAPLVASEIVRKGMN